VGGGCWVSWLRVGQQLGWLSLLLLLPFLLLVLLWLQG
jgi:hypothetical protein